MHRLKQILDQSKNTTRGLRKKKKKKSKNWAEAHVQDPPFPTLPDTPIVLSSAQSQTGFFSLPFELREVILTEAFGYARIHIDLQLLPPLHESLVSDSCPGSYNSPNLPLHRHLYQWDSPIRRWKWYSCFCYLLQNGLTGEYGVLPHHDLCRFDDELCQHRKASAPKKCRLGIIGFMMSCKQAYHEISNFIFSKCFIVIGSQLLVESMLRQDRIQGAPRLLTPNIELIESLQMAFDLKLFCNNTWKSEEAKQRDKFYERIELLPHTFPRLRNLILVLGGDTYSKSVLQPKDNREDLDKVLFEPLLKLRGKFPAMERFVVALPSSIINQIDEYIKAERICQKSGIWQIKAWYPFASNSGEGQGYWIKHGLVSSLAWHFDGAPFQLPRRASELL